MIAAVVVVVVVVNGILHAARQAWTGGSVIKVQR